MYQVCVCFSSFVLVDGSWIEPQMRRVYPNGPLGYHYFRIFLDFSRLETNYGVLERFLSFNFGNLQKGHMFHCHLYKALFAGKAFISQGMHHSRLPGFHDRFI